LKHGIGDALAALGIELARAAGVVIVAADLPQVQVSLMTARRPPLVLALLLAATGCVSSPPDGPLVEYRPGLPPVTRTVTCEADYTLVARDAAGAPGPFGVHHLRKGGRAGFRCEADGSLTAVAPGYTLALPPGAYAWEVVPESVPPLRERQLRAGREAVLTAAKVTGTGLLVTAATLLVLIIAL
jgi:hypothetical protein